MIASAKKYTMLCIKGIVWCFPNGFKVWLRKSPYLTSLYSRNLQKSGLFYGFPSRKKLDELYKKNIFCQNEIICTYDGPKEPVFSLLICVPHKQNKSLHVTLSSLKSIKGFVPSVIIYCSQEEIEVCRGIVSQYVTADISHLVVSHLSQNIPSDFSHQSWLLIYAGQRLHSDVGVCIAHHMTIDTDILYLDCDTESHGNRHSPEFFPDWNADLQLSTAYVKTAVWVSNFSLLQKFSLTPTHEGIAEWLIQVVFSDSHSVNVGHIPLVLLHHSEKQNFNMKIYGETLSTLLEDDAKVALGQNNGCLSLQWSTASQPLVSLIIPTKNAKFLVKACIESILKKTCYQAYEIILVDNNSDQQESLDYFAELALHPKIRVLKYPFPFNYSAINNFAVQHAKGEIIGLVNNDIEVISPEWLTFMLGHAVRNEVGCVGAKLLYPDGRIQHAGVVMGYGGGAGHAHKYFPRYHPGYLDRLMATGNYSAVTAACLLVKKSDYEEVGGLNEALEVAFNDVDFCLKVLSLGRRNVYCAEAELYHHESVSRGFDDTHDKRQRFERELTYLQHKWRHYIEQDPAYNPNLTLRRENFSIREY